MAVTLLRCKSNVGFQGCRHAAHVGTDRWLWAEAVWKRSGDVGGLGNWGISGCQVHNEGTSRSSRFWEGDLTVSCRPDVSQDDADQPCIARISPPTPSKATIRLML